MSASRLLVALAVMLGLLAGPLLLRPAVASCAADSGPDGSAVIFVGTMEEERRGYSRLRVTEVWAGPDLAEEVWLLSGQEQAPWPLYFFTAVGSSIDADFEIGEEYVVGASKNFGTGACSVSQPSSDTKRPSDAREPTADGLTGANPPLPPWLGILGLFLFPAALAAAFRYRGHRRRAKTSRPDVDPSPRDS